MSVTETPVSAPTMETWEIQVASEVRLKRTTQNRLGTAIQEEFIVGPNRIGQRFELSPDDRRDNQRLVADKEHDPFLNGMLRRVTGEPETEPEVASPNSISTEEIIDLIDLPEAEFDARIADMNEIALRRVLEMAEQVGASYPRVTKLQDTVRERFTPGGPQPSMLES